MRTIKLRSFAARRVTTTLTDYLTDIGMEFRLWWLNARRFIGRYYGFIGLALLLVGVGVALVFRGPVPTTAPPPIILVVTPTPLRIVREAAPRPNVPRLPRAMIAYPAPGATDGTPLERGWAYQVLARSGNEWTQIHVENGTPGGADVWVLSRDLPGYVPDVATPLPTATAQVVYVSAPAVAPAPVVEQAAPPAPQPTAEFIVDPVRAAACPVPSQEIGGLTYLCAVGEEDGQVYWFPARPTP